MATIGTSIELTDRMTAPLHNILNALNMTISGFQDMQNTLGKDIDTSSIDAAREQINQAAVALSALEEAGRDVGINAEPVIHPIVEPIVPEPLIDETPAPVEIPIEWKTPERMEIFTNSGIDRFNSEIQSANSMMETLVSTQQELANNSAQVEILPDNAVADLNNVNGRIQKIQSIIQKIEQNPINRLTSDAVNNDIEKLRSKLHEAVQQQNQLNNAMQNMDISAANDAYEQLQDTIAETEIYLRDNVDEQGQFNSMVDKGTKSADSLMKSIKGIVGAIGGMFAIGKVVGLINDCTEAASVQRKAETQLATTLVNMGGGRDDYDALVKKAAEIQQAGMYGDEALIGAAAEFSTYMNDTTAIEMMMDTLTNYAAGMSGGGAIDYTSMVDYATNLGKITTGAYDAMTKKGFEFTDAQKAVIDGTATQAQYVETLGEKWQDMSEDMRSATVISDIINESWAGMYESMSNTPEAKLQSLKNTFGDIQEKVGNRLNYSLGNLYGIIADNMPMIETFMMNAASALNVIIGIIGDIIQGVCDIGSFVSSNWSWIEPIIWGIVAAMTTWKIITGLHAISVGIASAAELGYTGIKGAAIAVTAALTGATVAETAAQYGMNAALYACPIVWIIAAVIALIVLFVIFTEEIMGAIWWLGALFKNIGLWIANCGIAAWEVIKNIGLWFANLGLSIWTVIKNIGLWFANLGQAIWAVIQNVGLWFANLGLGIWAVIKACASNIGTAFSNAWVTVQIGFWSMVNAIMQGLKSLAEKANKCLGWMGVNIDTSGLDFAAKKIDELEAKKKDYVDVGDAWAEASNTYAYKDVGDAFSTYDYGSVADAWNTNEIDWSKVGEGFNTFDTFQDGWGSDAYSKGAEVGAGISDWIDNNLSMGAILNKFGVGEGENIDAYDAAGFDQSQYLSDISDDTGKISDSMSITEEDLKYLRDIAERDVINRFTTAEVKVEFGDIHNNVSSDVDLDGMVTYISDRVAEELEVVAEGVHE